MSIARLARIAGIAALAMAAGASPASGSVTLGQLAPSPSGTTSNVDFIQLTVSSGNSYQVPENGAITAWSTNAGAATGQMDMKVFRKFADPQFFQVVGLDGPRNLQANVVNTFQVNIPVQAGDLIGLDPVATAVPLFPAGGAGDTATSKSGNLQVGDQGGFGLPFTGERLNLTAVFEPSNAVTVGSTTLNKKKGTGTLNLTVPNAGDLTATGSGASVSSARASGAVTAGPVQLLVKATGKKSKSLNQKGKVTLTVAVTYTPTNGDPSTQSVQVQLKKKLKKKK